MIENNYSTVWDLDIFFKGGSSSSEFAAHLKETLKKVSDFTNLVEEWLPSNTVKDHQKLTLFIEDLQIIAKRIRQEGAFISCLQAQDTTDKKVAELRANHTEISAAFQTGLTIFDHKLRKIDQDVWELVLEHEPLKDISFILSERRTRAFEKLSQEEESLINALSIDGYHSWGQMYDLIVSSIKIKLKEDGEEKLLSVGQAANYFSNSDRTIRQKVFKEWERAWGEKIDYLTKTLNHLAGFRLNVYKSRGWNDVLKEPLNYNRMEKDTLETMWTVVSENKQSLVNFLTRKAKLLGLEKLSWYDIEAPLNSQKEKLSFQQGAEFILEHFSKFGSELTKFTKQAFEDKWIEAEDRPGKAPGGFHTYFPESGQSRIFMTYSGTLSNVSTLAHELGHGFHTYAMRDLHVLNRDYAMNVAETASTFAEMIVSDASVKSATNKEQKIALLEDKVQRSVSFFMNIHARFLFETRFYEERQKGIVSTEKLNELMLAAQQEAYCGALEEYHPLFWASKLHFYITRVPFYNFPYTFGYLFSLGIYAKALEEGKGFENQYIALLKDTASMTVEELAMKHLNEDLTKRDFWERAVKLCVADIEEFLALTE
ncbi:M3 family oligoendopeptidase [Bacillus aquiflavi]|uniref:M3 family oligoendopeptidase n=1 Tax=Bacillus aquiflavi TaxID=2672567 RepID=A0A6B3VXM7_9BACI|nr:M3 family oligoendopeptidase [Bacillus aquiflavi]MBA4535911.1 M3 family oligoendopeptidase [Bacillus aquiflavi]NEY80286.1 M3 family oligoendopeptidase [Bacillus aquiflavi]UAC47327.1 M3 family oligoendopeptidase [Bacillus aquiflavi]